MTQLQGQMQNGNLSNYHLEFDLGKKSLNQTCETQNSLLFPGQSTIWKETNSKNDVQLKQDDQKFKNLTKQKTNTSIRKKSLCFITEINKLLNKNKIKTEFISRDASFLQKNFLNTQGQKRKIHYKSQRSTYCSTKNKQQQVEVQQSQNFKGNFYQQKTHQFQLKNSDDQKNKSPLKNNTFYNNNFKGKISILCNLKKNLCFNDVSNEPTSLGKSYDKLIITEQSAQTQDQNCLKQTRNVKERKSSQKSRLGKLIGDLQRLKIVKLTKTEKMSIKPSRKLTLEEEQGKQTIKKTNKQETIQFRRTLKGALSSTILCSPKYKFTNIQRNLSEISLQRRNQFLSNEHRTFDEHKNIDDFHYGKLKQNLKAKIENMYKANQFCTQPQITTISETSSMAVSNNDKKSEKFDRTERKVRRTNTAITRTGLQYILGQSYRKSSNNQLKRKIFLTGINNSAINSSSFQRNESLLIQELNQCKSQRIVRKLQQKYLSTPRFQNSPNISPQSSNPLTPKKVRTFRTSQKPTMQSTRITYQKMTSKQIEIEKMKQKLLQMMIDCDQERINKKNLTKGLNVFEDYCDDVDKGLKNISIEISQYLQKD